MSTETRKFRPFSWRPSPICAVFAALSLTPMMGLLQVQSQDSAASIPTEGRTIDRIEFDGLVTQDAVYLMGEIGMKAGATWDRDQVVEACRRLAATQKFEGTPYAVPREEEGRLILVFVVTERPFLNEITFVGNREFDDEDLLDEIDLEVGVPISDYLTRQAKQQVEAKYKEAGYSNVTVEVDEDVLRDEHRVLFRISEGPRVRVEEIAFEGNTSFSDLRLKQEIETATYVWIFRTGAFSEETAERDVASLKTFLVARGYLNAKVGYTVDFLDEEESELRVTFQIEEGLQHIFKSIAFEGNTVFDDYTLETWMNSMVGGPTDSDVLKLDRESIVTEYGKLGYIYADVMTSQVFDEEDGYVHLVVRIAEREQYRFGRIVIRGNRRTQDRVVRRELRFFPEELYNAAAVKRAETRLLETRLFKEATIKPAGDLPGARDALVSVEEAETTTLLFGVGVTSNSGVIGSISIEQRNFDLFDWPRTAGEFFKGRAFRGAGQTMRLHLEPGTELTRGRLSFREPYLFDKEIGLGLGVYAFERGRDEYDERRIGFYASFDKRWHEGLFEDWTGEVAFRFEQAKIEGTDWLTAPEIQKDTGNNWLTSVKGTLVHDRTDSRWMPSMGDRIKVAVEQFGALGGDHTFAKATANYDRYWTVKRDTFGRKHILQLGASLGQIFGEAPVFERFHAGGIGSMRGFEFRGISPRAGFRSDRIGGDFQLLANAQYSFPLVGKTIRGVTFLDMGTVEEEFGITDWRASVGFGVRIYVTYFGPIPLSFDLAAPISSNDDDDTQVFNFSFGTTF